jgi:hypothetical protein
MDQSQFELYKADFERVKSWDDIKQFVRKRNDHRYLAHKRCTRCEISGLMCTFHHLLDKDAFTVNCDAKDCYKSNGVCHGMEHGRIWPSHFVSSTPCDHCHHVGQLCRLQVPRKVLTGEINWRRSCAGSAKHCIWTGRPRPIDVVTFLTSFTETHPLDRHRSGDVYYFGNPIVCLANAESYKVPPIPILDSPVRVESAFAAVEPSRFTQVPYSSGSTFLHGFQPTMAPCDDRRSVDNNDDGSHATTIQSWLKEPVDLTHDQGGFAQTSLNEADASSSELELRLREFLSTLIEHHR